MRHVAACEVADCIEVTLVCPHVSWYIAELFDFLLANIGGVI